MGSVITGVDTNNAVKPINATEYDGITSLHTIPGRTEIFHVFLEFDALAIAKGFMLVDLSDTTNWPHTNTGHIHLLHILANITASKDAQADIEIGFLDNVAADNGDFLKLYSWKIGIAGTNERTTIVDVIEVPYGGIQCQAANWFGPTRANSTLFQTDVNLVGPDGATSYPSGDGDLVVYGNVSAGTVDLAIHIGYITDE